MGYWNEINMKETREIIRNDCMMTRQQNALDEAGGRFSKITPATVTGQSPASAQIPQQPPNSPWAYADRNVEPPFETDISFVEPILPASSADQSIGSPGDAGTEPIAHTSVVGSTKSQTPKPFRRF
jgi:hypothetical protein